MTFNFVPTIEVDDDGVYLGARDLDKTFKAMVHVGLVESATVEPNNLRLANTVYEQQVALREGGSTQARLERREAEFNWAKATTL